MPTTSATFVESTSGTIDAVRGPCGCGGRGAGRAACSGRLRYTRRRARCLLNDGVSARVATGLNGMSSEPCDPWGRGNRDLAQRASAAATIARATRRSFCALVRLSGQPAMMSPTTIPAASRTGAATPTAPGGSDRRGSWRTHASARPRVAPESGPRSDSGRMPTIRSRSSWGRKARIAWPLAPRWKPTPTPQAFPDVANGVLRLGRLHRPEALPSRRVQREDHGLIDGLRGSVEDGPRHPTHVEPVCDEDGEPGEFGAELGTRLSVPPLRRQTRGAPCREGVDGQHSVPGPCGPRVPALPTHPDSQCDEDRQPAGHRRARRPSGHNTCRIHVPPPARLDHAARSAGRVLQYTSVRNSCSHIRNKA